MIKKRPWIGITPGYDENEKKIIIKNGYYDAIIKAGGLPVIIPIIVDEEIISSMVEGFDGFLISGGPDLDAKHFNENNLIYNGTISPRRDTMELAICKKAINQGKPVLGICRGMQVINVAAGGTLYQDIHAQITGQTLIKHSQEAPTWYATHTVKAEKDSILWKVYKKEELHVNSFHHQAVKEVAPGFHITARSQDGIIEAIEMDTHPFALGVQWHPEHMWQEDDETIHLFEAFVAACR